MITAILSTLQYTLILLAIGFILAYIALYIANNLGLDNPSYYALATLIAYSILTWTGLGISTLMLVP